jgi:hypothetical protein
MHKDKVYYAIFRDPLVHDIVRMRMAKVNGSVHHINYVRGHIRNLGKVLLELRKNVKELKKAAVSDIISPLHFNAIVSAVKTIAACGSNNYSPSVGVNVGHDLSFCAEMVKSAAYMKGDLNSGALAEQFEAVKKARWNCEISGGARRELQTRKFNNPKLLPLTSDVMKFSSHLKDLQTKALAVVSETDDNNAFCTAFKVLSETSLAQLILFNRRRQGEASKLTVDIYSSHAHRDRTNNPEVEECLSQLERQLCSLYSRIEVPGKRNRAVPLLLTADMKAVVNKLVDRNLRSRAEIHTDNPFVFALTRGSLSHIRGCDVLRKESMKCGATRPHDLRSTNFRKHIATMSQILNLKESELDQLAQFMGHDIKIHREFYRLPNDVVQTAQVVKVLMSMENGSIAELRGKSLAEIDVSDVLGTYCCVFFCSNINYIN